MKFLFSVVLIFSIHALAMAQANVNFVGGFNGAELTFVDGHIEKGEISEFLTNANVASDAVPSFTPDEFVLEELFDLTDERFTFKDDTGKRRTVKSEELTSLKVTKFGHTYEFIYVDVRKITEDFFVSEKRQKAWLPLLYKGDVSVLGFSVMKEDGDYYASYVYLKRKEDDYALVSANIGLLFPFIKGETIEKIEMVFNVMYSGCDAATPYFKKELQTWDIKDKSKMKKIHKAKKKEYKVKKSEGSKLVRYEKKRDHLGLLYIEAYAKMYSDAVKELNNRCLKN